MKELGESFPMNTNMTGFQWFSKKYLRLCNLVKRNLSIRRVKLSGLAWFLTYHFFPARTTVGNLKVSGFDKTMN